MSGYNDFDILHAGVANFDCVAVIKDLMKRVGRRECLLINSRIGNFDRRYFKQFC
jgi:hypothetical protein